MATFELGSLICGVAPNSILLIVGRAIAGFGSAGIVTGSFVVVAHSVPLQKRPTYTGLVGVMYVNSRSWEGVAVREKTDGLNTGLASVLLLDLCSGVFLRIV